MIGGGRVTANVRRLKGADMRTYRLTPVSDICRLTPHELLRRLKDTFARVESDAEEARPLGSCVIESYRRMLNNYEELRKQADDLPTEPTPLHEIELIWRNAIHIHVWLDNDRRFSTIANNAEPIKLLFTETVSSQMRRSVTLEVARILGYNHSIVDEPV
jgi:hypothetical protein